MSSAFYPLGMKSYNNHLPQGGYKTWKGTGPFSNPIGISAGHIRPLTNKDPGNVFPTGFGLPRPIKHFRKGRVIPVPPISIVNEEDPVKAVETSLIDYNLNRNVKSSKGSSLGGGAGGRGLLNQVMDTPGSYLVKQNNVNEMSNELNLNADCDVCQGVGLIVNYYPNNTYLTENPETVTTTPPLCCNEERKARRRVLPANTNLPKNYYTTNYQYLQNRCQTYEQRVFNFQNPRQAEFIAAQANNPYITAAALKASKPGDPLSYLNTYFANCQPNGEIYEATELFIIDRFVDILNKQNILTPQQIASLQSLVYVSIKTLEDLYKYLNELPQPTKDEALALYISFISNPYTGIPITGPTNPLGCKLVVYKPNNPQFAQQGAVESSTRTLKLNVNTINCNLQSFNEPLTCNITTPFILKSKSAPCRPQYFTKDGNPKTCFPRQNGAMLKNVPGNVYKGRYFNTAPGGPPRSV
jgi:hypothetical protein